MRRNNWSRAGVHTTTNIAKLLEVARGIISVLVSVL